MKVYRTKFDDSWYFNLAHFKGELFELDLVLDSWLIKTGMSSEVYHYYSKVIKFFKQRDFWNFRYLLEDYEFILKKEFACVLSKHKDGFVYKCLQFSDVMNGSV